MSKRIKFKGVRLSENTETKVIANINGVNGFANEAANGNQFYIADFIILDGARPVAKSEVIWAGDDGKFVQSAEEYREDMQAMSDEKELRGHLFTEEYDYSFNDRTGKTVKAQTVTLLCFDGQSETRIFNNWVKGQMARAAATAQNKPAGGVITEAQDENVNAEAKAEGTI